MQLTELIRERDAWEKRCRLAELENETLKEELKHKDRLLLDQNKWIIEKDDLLQRKDALL
ncbi:hypothetical protein A2U01_0086388, partial [Trifolium medium]|nr:hypothetical protein [Trifolium medium]